MPELSANVARYLFEASELPEDTFSVLSFRSSERMSGLSRYEIELVSADEDVAFEEVVNKRARFVKMRLGERVPIAGVISEFKQGPRIRQHYLYSAVLVPRLWRLTLSHRCRVFQKMTVEDIVKQVLEDNEFAPADFRFDLNRTLPEREYCVQYQETDFAFVSRLLEHEGIYYLFESDDERDRVVFVDDRQAHEEIDGDDVVRFHEGAGMAPGDAETAFSFQPREQVVTGKVVLKDYNYRTPQTSLQVESQINGDMPGEMYEYGDHFKDSAEGEALAQIRNQQIECGRRVIEGKGTCMAFQPGFLFTIDDHFRSDLNDEEYLLTEVEQEGSQRRAVAMELGFRLPDTEAEEGREQHYVNRFLCIPASVQFRPARRTLTPKVAGIMTAKIESAGGDYAYLDDEGRYRAKMFFDLETTGSAEATRAIRMSQPHSGPDYGVHFPHHADTEMVWACIDGDVDRPIALGTVPNPSQKAPSVDENRMQNIIRTKAGNQIVMDDTIDKAQVQINSPDAHTVLLDDKDDKIEIVTTNKHKILLNDKGANVRVQTTSGHFVLMQDDDNGGKITVQSKDGHWIGINDEDSVITVADESGENTFIIDAQNGKLVIRTDNGHIDMHAPNGTIDIQANELKIDVAGDTKISTGSNHTVEAGADYKMSSGGNMELDAGMDLEQSAGLNVKSEAGINHESKGGVMIKAEATTAEFKGSAMATFQGGGTAFLKGGVVMIN